MNSIERVKAAINFSGPDKVPIMNYGKANSDVWPMITMPSKNWKPGFAEDEKGLFPYSFSYPVLTKKWQENPPEWAKDPKYKEWWKGPHEEIDEWGCIWQQGTLKTIGHPSRPSLPDWNNLDGYLERYTPDPEDRSRYSLFLNLTKEFGKGKYRMVLLGPHAPFSIAANMRGFENFMTDHILNPDKVRYLLNYLKDWFIKNMKMWAKYGDPHGFIIADDLGTQDSPFVSPQMFNEFYEPLYHPMFETAHDLGCEFHLHSCGKVDRLIPYFIDWKLDALEFDSPRMSGYTDLRPFRGKIMFWGCVNIQSIYTLGTPEECEREVWHMMRNLGTKNGGFGAYFYPQPEHIKAPSANIRAFARGLRKYGNYSKIPLEWWEHPTVEVWEDNIVPPLPPIKI